MIFSDKPDEQEEQVRNFTDQERENLRNVFRKADEEAEKMVRSDCVRVQKRLAQIRQRYGIEE